MRRHGLSSNSDWMCNEPASDAQILSEPTAGDRSEAPQTKFRFIVLWLHVRTGSRLKTRGRLQRVAAAINIVIRQNGRGRESAKPLTFYRGWHGQQVRLGLRDQFLDDGQLGVCGHGLHARIHLPHRELDRCSIFAEHTSNRGQNAAAAYRRRSRSCARSCIRGSRALRLRGSAFG